MKQEMLIELKEMVYEANMELPQPGASNVYLGKCQRN